MTTPPDHAHLSEVTFINDGDTLKATVNLELGNWIKVAVRFEGINAQSMNTVPGQVARAFVSEALLDAEAIAIAFNGQEKYGRWLGTVYYLPPGENWRNLNQDLLDAGHAQPYNP